jgi:hypothetical protein
MNHFYSPHLNMNLTIFPNTLYHLQKNLSLNILAKYLVISMIKLSEHKINVSGQNTIVSASITSPLLESSMYLIARPNAVTRIPQIMYPVIAIITIIILPICIPLYIYPKDIIPPGNVFQNSESN